MAYYDYLLGKFLADQQDAEGYSLKSEGYAKGTQNGAAVSSGSPYYQANAKYYKEQAESVYNNIPADYSVLSTQVDRLEYRVAIPSLTIGGLDNNHDFSSSITYRVATKDILHFDYKVVIRTLRSVSDYRVNINIYDDDDTWQEAFALNGCARTSEYYQWVVPENTRFRLVISRYPETSSPAVFDDFASIVEMVVADNTSRFDFPFTPTSGKYYATNKTAYDGSTSSYASMNAIAPTPLVIDRIKYDLVIRVCVNSSALAVALYDKNKTLLYSVVPSENDEVITVKTSNYPTAYYFKASYYNTLAYKSSTSITVENITKISLEVDDIESKADDAYDLAYSIVNEYTNVFDKNATSETGYLQNGVITGSSGTTWDYIEITKYGSYISNCLPKNHYGQASLGNAIAFYDSDKTFISNATITMIVDAGNRSIGTFTIPSTVSYIRVTTSGIETPGIAMIVYGNTLPYSYVPKGTHLLADVDFQKAIFGNPLTGKIAVFDGDSICAEGTDNSHEGAYAGRISVQNGIQIYNYAVGGGTITSETYSGSTPRHWVVDSIDTIYAQHPDADYIILEGGTNDADEIGSVIGATPERFGTFNLTDYSGSYDDETFCGAVETLLYKAINYYPKGKIGFVIAPKMGKTSYGYTATTNNRRAYFQTIMDICTKWGIPYINLWDECHMNPSLTVCYDSSMTTQQNIDAGKLYKDGQHPTPDGYDYFAPIIGEWMKTL